MRPQRSPRTLARRNRRGGPHPSGLVALVAVVLLLTALSATVAGETSFADPWRWVRFGTESGLPHNDVLAVAETPAGTIWAGTRDGIAHFDGYRWTPASDIPAMPASRLADVGQDSVLVVLGERLFRGGKKGFCEIPVNGGSGPLPVHSAARLDASSAIVLAGGRLFVLGNDSTVASPIPHPGGEGDITRLWRSRDATWVTTRGGVFRRGKGTWDRVLSAFTRSPSILQTVSTADGESLVYVVHPVAQRGFHRLRGTSDAVALTSTDRLHMPVSFDIRADGTVCSSYETGEFLVYDGERWEEVPMPIVALRQINILRFGSSGDLWAGTARGLFHWRRNQPEWQRLTTPSGGGRNQVNEFLEADDGTLWIGTGDGVEERRADGEVVWHSGVAGTRFGHITAVNQDTSGHVWIGSGGAFAGAYRWDGSSWRHFGAESGLGDAHFHKIRRDRRGRLWFLALGGHAPSTFEESRTEPGAFVLEGEAFHNWNVETGLLSGRVYAFAEGPDGAYWFGTIGYLSRFQGGTWTHWPIDASRKMRRVFALAVDAEGEVWVSDQWNGLGHLVNGEFRWKTSDDGLACDQVNDIRLGPDGSLWLATAQGLSCLANGQIDSLTTSHGLSGHSLLAVLPRRDRVYVGAQASGTDVLLLDQVSAKAPRIRLLDSSVDGNSVFLRWSVNAFWGRIPPAEVLVRHRLDGGTWSAWSNDHALTLTNQDAGTHLLESQARGFLGCVSRPPTSTTFLIEPPLILRPAFYTPIGALGLLLAVFGVLTVVRKARDNRRLRETLARLGESEEQLRQAQKMEAIGKLAGGVAHDFNNLLVAILGHCELLTLEKEVDAGTRDHIDEIRKAGERAETLTRQLLAFSRKQMLRPRTLDLNAALADLLDLVQRLIGENIEISTDLADTPVLAHADQQQVEQVVLNLVTNARDAMPGGGSLAIATALTDLSRSAIDEGEEIPAGRYAAISVSDTGSGMDRETLGRIFEPFFTTKDVGKGTGLGLSTAYGIVRQSGGVLRARSTPGRGSVFEVLLPAASPDERVEPAREAARALPRGQETILVAEDEKSVCEVITTTLTRAGYRVLVAENGRRALEIAGAEEFGIDLVLTDVVMPQMSGTELVASLTAAHPDIKVLFMTGYSDDALVGSGLLEVGAMLLEKPFTPAELAQRIRELLDRR
jgi:signal transduction histidine kinase/ligand-binding sensor domain-containing protein